MPEIILHHYPLSPYSEKTRLAMGLKGLTWRSVEIPIWTPRPLLTPMTGGYRKTPILQIGADFYCDTLLILRKLDTLSPTNALYPSDNQAMVKALCWWIEKSSFVSAVCLTIGNMGGKFPDELIKERRPFFGQSVDPADLLPKRELYAQRFTAQLEWLCEMLADGRAFLLGSKATAADLSAYHMVWFARQNGGPEIEALLPIARLEKWYDRVSSIGHGRSTSLAPEEAVAIAEKAQPADEQEISADGAGIGLNYGDWVSVTPDDYGNAVFGRLLVWSPEEIILRHEDPSVGRVNLHFPRVGFDVRPEKKA